MNQKNRLLKCLVLTSAAALTPALAPAAGLVGQRYVSASYEYLGVQSHAFDDGDGYTFFGNLPLAGQTDLGIGYSHFEKNSARAGMSDATGEAFLLAGTFIGRSEEGVPFLRVGLGWTRVKSGGASDDALLHSIGAGAEIPAGGSATVTPFVSWEDSFDGTIDGVFTYGMSGELALGRMVSLVARAAGDDHFNWTGGVGVAVKF